MINKSFSKGDMLDIIRQFNLDIPNSNNMDKLKLSITLWSYVNNLKDIEPDREIYLIENKEELLKYLSEHNPDKLLSVKEKGKLMNFCKRLSCIVLMDILLNVVRLILLRRYIFLQGISRFMEIYPQSEER